MSEHDNWPVNDLHGLAQRLPGLDPDAYYDEQRQRAYEAALVRCPALARLLGLPDACGVGKRACAASATNVNNVNNVPHGG
ncbi:hypothetical protein [Caballeronia sordidicola]|uniref:Uncharacterized protein n=1 Tax=Caballeronia sordidicola TaxID=196367 RepID=A0A226WRP2_CABSO|nr:hypothetical protein [Caballeronia sordidicola]OXC73500.1 hypothetical protein BSU04_35510 [Caballeronia sordidicola]